MAILRTLHVTSYFGTCKKCEIQLSFRLNTDIFKRLYTRPTLLVCLCIAVSLIRRRLSWSPPCIAVQCRRLFIVTVTAPYKAGVKGHAEESEATDDYSFFTKSSVPSSAMQSYVIWSPWQLPVRYTYTSSIIPTIPNTNFFKFCIMFLSVFGSPNPIFPTQSELCNLPFYHWWDLSGI